MTNTRLPLAALLGTLVLAAACGDSTGPTERTESDLNILRLAPGAPAVFNPTVSAWARRGRNLDLRVYFENPQRQQGDLFLELKLDDESLLAYPNGRPFAPDDSVLITVRVIDAARILFEFSPAGLQFNRDEPAELEISYRLADPDLNRDGVVDSRDRDIELELAIWRQPTVGLPFLKLGTLQFDDLDELEADLTGFSRLAIAY